MKKLFIVGLTIFMFFLKVLWQKIIKKYFMILK